MNADKRREDLLREASAFGDEEGIQELLNAGVDVNSQHSVNGWTGLHWAAKRGRSNAVRLLLSKGADPSLKSAYGETALSLTNNDEVRSILSGDPDSQPEYVAKPPLPITPNYLSNPALAPKISKEYSNSSKEENIFESPKVSEVNPTAHHFSKPGSEELVLKVRVADALDEDFIEVEMPTNELTFENLFKICCEELQLPSKQVQKLRKLPNTIVRKDKDVLRFQNFQELELVLHDSYKATRPQTFKQYLPDKSYYDGNKFMDYSNSECSSPLVKKSNYCKNGTILY